MALKGIKVLEFEGLAPAPFCGMILADFGASVVRIDKVNQPQPLDYLGHGKLCLGVNLKHPDGVQVIKRLSKASDVLIEPYRAGVMEKLGLGPKVLMGENKGLVYARLSGYGQTGPLAKRAGHDINYIALSGLLSMFGSGRKPEWPVNVVADFAGGGLTCALGITLALLERSRSGMGQMVDCSMLQGAAYLGTWFFKGRNMGLWEKPRGQNLLDGGAHYYNTYETLDGKWMAVGPLEPQFYSLFLKHLGLPEGENLDQVDKEAIQKKFKEHTQEYWTKVFEDVDACVTPVVELEDTKASLVETVDGTLTPVPAPALSRTPGVSQAAKSPVQYTLSPLIEVGYTHQELSEMLDKGVISCNVKSKL